MLDRMIPALLGCLAVVGTARAQSVALPPQRGMSLATVFSSIGVDTHLAYTDGFGMYGDGTTLVSALSFLGLTQLRDGLPSNQTTTMPGYAAASHMELLAAQGYQFDLVFADATQPVAYDRANLDQLFAGVGGEYDGPPMRRGALRFVEGLNEITNENPQPSIAAATAWQRDLLCLTRQAAFCPPNSVDPNVSGARVAEFTSDGLVTTTAMASATFPADLMNAHPYAAPSNRYGESIATIIAGAFSADYGVTPPPSLSEAGEPAAPPPAIITEAGAYTEPFDAGRSDLQYLNGYDPHIVAIKDLDTLLDGLAIGAPTYLYQLFDNYDFDADNQYGLFTYGGLDGVGHPLAVPTPAATAIHNFTTLARTQGMVSSPTANNCLQHTVSGLPSGARTLMVQLDNSGDYGIVLWWDNPNDWDKDQHAEIAVQPVLVTVNFADPAFGAVFDPMRGTNALSWQNWSRSLSVSLGDDPLLLFVHTANAAETCRA